MIKFSPANAKLRKLAKALGVKANSIWSFDLPAGRTCPGADICKSMVVKGKIKDGLNCLVRCYAASQEVMYPYTHRMRMNNLGELLMQGHDNWQGMRDLLISEIPHNARIIRIHSSGDFFSPHYFRAWCAVLAERSDLIGYGYTKSLAIVREYQRHIPVNLRLTASVGGKFDRLISGLGLPSVTIVRDQAHADSLGLPVDSDDSHAYMANQSFALVVHGTQPKGGARI